MAFPSTPSFTVLFDRDPNSASYNKFSIADTTDYAGAGVANADVEGYYVITYPNGASHVGSFASPDYGGSVSLVYNTLALPTDSLGEIQSGTYLFQQFVRVSGAVIPGDYQSAVFTIDTDPLFCILPITPDISATSDCFQGIMSVTNSTSYGIWTASSRELSVYPPPSLSLPPYVVAAASLNYAFQYDNATYEITVNDLLTYSSGIFSFTYRVEGSENKTINCDINLCRLRACINSYLDTMRTDAAQYNGYGNLSRSLTNNLANLFSYYIQFENAASCSYFDAATTYYNKIAEIVSAGGCNCGCSDSTTPTPFTPISQVNNTVVVQGVSPIQVTSVTVGSTTTYTVTTTAGFNATFAQYGTDILALQGDVTTIQGQITTIQGQITALQATVLDQVVANAEEVAIPNTSTYTTAVTYTNAIGSENGTEWFGRVSFLQTTLPVTQGFRLQINGSTAALWEKATTDQYGNSICIDFSIKKQSNTKVQVDTLYKVAYDTLGLLNSPVEIILAEQNVTEVTVADLSANTLVITLQAKSSNATLELTAGNIKKYTKV